MRWATLALFAVLALVACNDVRQFHGTWRGARVGSADVLRVGFPLDASAVLAVDHVDAHGLQGELTIPGLVDRAPVASLPGAEADVLAGMTFGGAPLRVYVAFVDVPDGAGQAFVLVALYDDHRVEVRVLRGGAMPLYGIFALTEDA